MPDDRPWWARAAGRLRAASPGRHAAEPAVPDSPATEADIDYCYRLLLGRKPDPGGLRTFRAMVANGVTVDDLVSRMVSSAEFRRRLMSTFGWSEGGVVSAECGPFTMYVRDNDPGVGQTIRTEGRYEPHVTEAVRAVLRPGDTFVDVGASIGYFSCLAGQLVGPTGRVLAFEPGAENVSLLLLNLLRNAIEHVRVYPVALGDADGVSLYSGEGSNGTARSGGIDVGALAVGSLVPVARLDDLLPRDIDVRMIKLDVEGSEGLVLRGAADLIERCRPTIALEFSPAALPVESGVGSDELLDWLRALGYGIDVLGSDPTAAAPPAGRWCDRTNAEVAELFAALGTEHLDLLAWPRDAPVPASS